MSMLPLPDLSASPWPAPLVWSIAGRATGFEDAVDRAIADLAHLQALMAQPGRPQDLCRDRLALEAAVANVRVSCRPKSLTRRGDPLKPPAEVGLRTAASRPW